VVLAERNTGSSRRRIVLTTFGSLGDLHPYIAVALGLKARGHEAVIATSDYYRQKIEALGIGFRAVRPDHPDLDADADLMRRIMDRRTGSSSSSATSWSGATGGGSGNGWRTSSSSATSWSGAT
jgi:hypothetical protein